MTPFKKAGYTKDTKFKVLRNYGDLKVGDIVKVRRDDVSDIPFFITEDGRQGLMYLPGEACIEELEVYVEEKPDISAVIAELEKAKEHAKETAEFYYEEIRRQYYLNVVDYHKGVADSCDMALRLLKCGS